MRPSDDQLWVWLNLGNARALYEEAQRARAEESRMLLVGEDTAREIEALEAKLREAEARAETAERERDEARADASRLGAWHPHSAVGALRLMRAEKERDEARAEVVALKRRLEWASKDAHTLHGPLTHVGPWEDCDADSCTEDRAALGEKP